MAYVEVPIFKDTCAAITPRVLMEGTAENVALEMARTLRHATIRAIHKINARNEGADYGTLCEA